MAIAANPVLADPTHVSSLPPSWGTLYELSRLDEPVLLKAIQDCRVHPKMERKDVAALDLDKDQRREKKERKRSPHQEQEAAERVLRAALAAITKLVRVNVRHVRPKRVAGWADELGSAMVGVERLCDTLRDLMPADVEAPHQVPISEQLAL